MILTINRETGTRYTIHRLVYLMEAHSVICEVQTEYLCYRSSGPHAYSEIRLPFSEGQAGGGWDSSTKCPSGHLRAMGTVQLYFPYVGNKIIKECGEEDALTSMKMNCQLQAQAALSSCLPASRFSGPRVVSGTVYMKTHTCQASNPIPRSYCL
jgi:hypothetical protein